MNGLRIDPSSLCYRALIGVGGIGAGSFFAITGNETLGREESRGGRFLERRDYCKLHIIAHYVATLLGHGFSTIPVGQVGDDEVGRRLLAEMAAVGLDLRYVQFDPDAQTLFSFCLVYPDRSGGNLTTDDSACSKVDAAFVARAAAEFRTFRDHGIALAAPEVPIDARAELLRLGAANGFFGAASFTSQELRPAIDAGLLESVDLLALNRDEAAVAAQKSPRAPAHEIAHSAIERLCCVNSSIWLSITAGREGSWSWNGSETRHVPALEVPVSSTAGAGDAHLAGILAGIAVGLPLASAQQLGTLLATVSVTSPHTIHPAISRALLREFACRYGANLDGAVFALLED
jgi:ribokinase